jgi:hypothetical protein
LATIVPSSAALYELVDLLMEVYPILPEMCTQILADWDEREIYACGRTKHSNFVQRVEGGVVDPLRSVGKLVVQSCLRKLLQQLQLLFDR